MIDTLLQNRYRLEAELGRGGMGTVYRAHDILLDRDVAVKLLGVSNLSSESRARLLREARAAARLNHPNIVLIHDAGEADLTHLPLSSVGDLAAPYIVMELVEGESLFERKPRSLDEIIAVTQQVCAALEHAHAHGIVHRDLKPENVLITPDGVVKLMDFGLARSGASRLSSEGAIIGTVFYLAPEQARGQTIDGRADLYALGVMLYELTTGRLPFTGDDPLAVIAQHLHADVVPPRTHRADLSPAMEAIILKLLAKLPNDRFASAREVATALAEAAQGRLPRSAVTPRHNLPIQLTSFVGRERESAAVKQLLVTSRLVTLTGTGGCGKTRLALKVAEDCLADYADGVWLVELGPVSDPALVPQTVAALLNVREEPGHPLVKTLADYLRSKSLLLFLDNCEHLIEACAHLAETFLRACPNVKILASSREAFGIAGETSFRVPSLSAPHPHRLSPGEDVLSYAQYEAVRLFLDRAVSVRPDFQLTATNAPALAQICHRLDGLPLAIELAAARVSAMTVDQIATRLDDRFRLLTGGSRTALPRQQTLKALIDWSWDLLSDVERTLLRRLSVFVGGWTLEAAEAVVSDDVLAASNVLDTLTQLVNKSLVVMEDQGGAARYRLLETIREYARDRLIQAGETEAVRSRHLDFFLQLAEMAEPALRRADQVEWLARLEMEHDNLRMALKWSLHHETLEAGWRIAGDLARFWYLRGYWNEGREWLERLLSHSWDEASASELTFRARAQALCGAGWLADDSESAVAPYTEALALWRRVGDKWGTAYSLRGLGAEGSIQSLQERAAPYLDESLALFRELGDAWGAALAMFNLGWVAFNRDDTLRAEALWEEALGLFRQSGDRWGTAVVLGSLSYFTRLKGDYARAAVFSAESLALFRELGDKAGISTSLNRLGTVALRRGDYREAKALLEENLALERERGDRSGLITTLNLLGVLACNQCDYERAAALFEESLAMGQETDDEYNRPAILGYYVALLAYYRGDLDGAAALWRENLPLLKEHEDRTGVAFAQSGLGLVAYWHGDYRMARQQLEEGLALSRIAGDKRYVSIALNGLAKVMGALGEPARALALFREGLSLRKEMGARRGISESLEGLAGMAVGAQGDHQRAARLFGAAAALRQAIGAPVPLVERAEVDRNIAATRAQFDEVTFVAAWAEGRAMTMEQAISFALETGDK
jgi:non-specific serine/threonine protein kinase